MILFGLLTGRDSHFPFIFLPVLHTKMDSGQQRQSFEDEAVAIGLGKKFAMKRIDEMREGVQDALNEATESLAAEGFDSAEEVKERIMQRGGIHYL